MIYIPGDVVSSKNSKLIRKKRNTPPGKGYFIGNNDLVLSYKKFTVGYYIKNAPRWKYLTAGMEHPLKVDLILIRRTKGLWDFNNICQVVADQMKDCKYICDDNVKVISFVLRGWYISKEYCGVIIAP